MRLLLNCYGLKLVKSSKTWCKRLKVENNNNKTKEKQQQQQQQTNKQTTTNMTKQNQNKY